MNYDLISNTVFGVPSLTCVVICRYRLTLSFLHATRNIIIMMRSNKKKVVFEIK